jgi:hypothetical protein
MRTAEEREMRYWQLATLGGGNAWNYLELYTLCIRVNRTANHKDFRRLLKKAIEYNWIEQNRTGQGRLWNTNLITFNITDKGSDALEALKKERYFGGKESFYLDSGYVDPQKQYEYLQAREQGRIPSV